MSEGTLSLSDAVVGVEELLTEAEITKLKATHAEFTVVKTAMGPAAFRAPTRAEYGRFNQLLFDEKTRSKATEALVATCVVLPDRKTFESWLDKYPGIPTTCADAVSKLAGVETDAQTKKYTPA